MAGQPLRIATVTTITDSVIVRLEKAVFLRVVRQESEAYPAVPGRFRYGMS